MRSSTSVGVVNGGARQIVSPTGRSALPVRMRGCNPRAGALRDALGPKVVAGGRIDQLRGHPHAVAGLADTALDHVANPQLARHLAHLHRLALVGERAVAPRRCDLGVDRYFGKAFEIEVEFIVLDLAPIVLAISRACCRPSL